MSKSYFVFVMMLGLALSFLAAGPPLLAQTTYGAVTGTIIDPTGVAVADAEVALRKVGTSEKRVQSSGPDGLYNFVNLIPGKYRIAVEKVGFKRSSNPDILVEVGQTARMDITLQVGERTETVEVTSQTPLLQAETSSMGQVVEQRRPTSCPLMAATFSI